MANWSSLGHGMRRRIGLPSNHLESAGNKVSRKHATSDEIYQAHATMGSARIPMGMSAYQVSPAPAPQGTLVPKKNLQAGDPTNPGSKQNRVNQPYSPERLGAAYSVKTNFLPTTDPVAGRQNPNFTSGIQSAEL